MSTSKTKRSRIKRKPIIGLLFMLCFMLASKVGASALSQARDFINRNREALTFGGNYEQVLCQGTKHGGVGQRPRKIIVARCAIAWQATAVGNSNNVTLHF